MNYRDWVDQVSEDLNLPYTQVDRVLSKGLDVIRKCLKLNEQVNIRSFGVFETRQVKPRAMRFIQTNETIHVPGYRGLRFRPSKTLKEEIKRNPSGVC